MPSASKAKGSNWERDVAKHLTEVFGLNHTRVPNSGAFTGRSNFHRMAVLTPAQQLLMTGDIIMPEQLSRFCIECKFYKEVSFVSLFDENSQLDKWIEQSRVAQRAWFILFKANHTNGFVVYDPKNQAPVVPSENYMHYKGLIITQMPGFFERNKDCMLQYNLQTPCAELSSTTTTQLSASTN